MIMIDDGRPWTGALKPAEFTIGQLTSEQVSSPADCSFVSVGPLGQGAPLEGADTCGRHNSARAE